jgi:hypothetical protein
MVFVTFWPWVNAGRAPKEKTFRLRPALRAGHEGSCTKGFSNPPNVHLGAPMEPSRSTSGTLCVRWQRWATLATYDRFELPRGSYGPRCKPWWHWC